MRLADGRQGQRVAAHDAADTGGNRDKTPLRVWTGGWTQHVVSTCVGGLSVGDVTVDGAMSGLFLDCCRAQGMGAHTQTPQRPRACPHYAHGRVWECRRCKNTTAGAGRGRLGRGVCGCGRRIATCRRCGPGAGEPGSAFCQHGLQKHRCTRGCRTNASVCPCGTRATECKRCAPRAAHCPHGKRWRRCSEQACSRRSVVQACIVKLEYITANLTCKNAEFKPSASKCRWTFPRKGAPTILVCSTSDYATRAGTEKRRYPTHPCTHWAYGIVDYSRPVTIRNLRQDLAREWADWHDAALRAATIDKLAKKYRSGLVYRIKNRMLFDEPVAVRVTRRNYGDGWVRAEHVELRNAVSLPAWTRVPQPIRRAMARARCSEQ